LSPDPKLARGDKALAQNNKTPYRKLGHMKPGFRGSPGLGPVLKTNVARNSMPDQPISDSQYFRGLAGKARARARHATDDVTKHFLHRIAETYERVADRVEQRSPNNEKSK
jgi:hypothetical protein